MPHDPRLAERMRQALAPRGDLVEKRMFGGVCWMWRGHMLCGVESGRCLFRVGKDLEADALRQPGARRMDFTGRPMRGFVWVDADEAVKAGLSTWIERAARYVGSLPAK